MRWIIRWSKRLTKPSSLKVLLPLVALMTFVRFFPLFSLIFGTFFYTLYLFWRPKYLTVNHWFYPTNYDVNPASGLVMTGHGVDVAGNAYGTYNDINPASGLPMAGPCIDVAGDPYGTDSHNGYGGFH